ncbi:MAG: acyltransferase [Caulobacter sp.]|nr:acyltransferase [Caulobacter sp.]
MQDAANIRPLTSLRFFAAMWVVLFHYWPDLAGVGPETGLVAKGYLGVELFFVLSGFILCHVYLASAEEGRFRYGAFLWNRLARVYPLHLFTLAGVIALGVAATLAGLSINANILDWASLPANLTLTQAWGLAPQAAFNHPSWSISAEWFAYLSFPAFAWAAIRLKNRPWLGVGLALALIAVLYPLFERLAGYSLTEATIRWGALRIVPCFALGCAMHGLWRSGALANRTVTLLGASISGVAIAATAFFGASDALAVAGFGGLIASLASLSNTGSTFGSQPIFVYLGEISYSIYMICVPWKILFVNTAAKWLNLSDERLPLYVWLIFLVSVIPLAAASYHLVESPMRSQMKLWAKARQGRRMAAAGA